MQKTIVKKSSANIIMSYLKNLSANINPMRIMFASGALLILVRAFLLSRKLYLSMPGNPSVNEEYLRDIKKDEELIIDDYSVSLPGSNQNSPRSEVTPGSLNSSPRGSFSYANENIPYYVEINGILVSMDVPDVNNNLCDSSYSSTQLNRLNMHSNNSLTNNYNNEENNIIYNRIVNDTIINNNHHLSPISLKTFNSRLNKDLIGIDSTLQEIATIFSECKRYEITVDHFVKQIKRFQNVCNEISNRKELKKYETEITQICNYILYPKDNGIKFIVSEDIKISNMLKLLDTIIKLFIIVVIKNQNSELFELFLESEVIHEIIGFDPDAAKLNLASVALWLGVDVQIINNAETDPNINDEQDYNLKETYKDWIFEILRAIPVPSEHKEYTGIFFLLNYYAAIKRVAEEEADFLNEACLKKEINHLIQMHPVPTNEVTNKSHKNKY